MQFPELTGYYCVHNLQLQCPLCKSKTYSNASHLRDHIYQAHLDHVQSADREKARESVAKAQLRDAKKQTKKQKVKQEAKQHLNVNVEEKTDDETAVRANAVCQKLRAFYSQLAPKWTLQSMQTYTKLRTFISLEDLHATADPDSFTHNAYPHVTCDGYGCRNTVYGGLFQQTQGTKPIDTGEKKAGGRNDTADAENSGMQHFCTGCIRWSSLPEGGGELRSVISCAQWAKVLALTAGTPALHPDGSTFQAVLASEMKQPSLAASRVDVKKLLNGLLACKSTDCEDKHTKIVEKPRHVHTDHVYQPFGKAHDPTKATGTFSFTPESSCWLSVALASVFDQCYPRTLASFKIDAGSVPPVPHIQGTLVLCTPGGVVGRTPSHLDPAMALNLLIPLGETDDAEAGFAIWIGFDIHLVPLDIIAAVIKIDYDMNSPKGKVSQADFITHVNERFEALKAGMDEYHKHLTMVKQGPGVGIRVLPMTWHTVLTYGPVLKVACDYCVLESAAEIVIAERHRRRILEHLKEKKMADAFDSWKASSSEDFVHVDWFITQSMKENL